MPVRRDKLYEEVWAEPMTKVAFRYFASFLVEKGRMFPAVALVTVGTVAS